MRAVLDRLRAQSKSDRETLSQAAAARQARLSVSALRFAPGDRVIDLTTGVRGVVRHGDHDPQTNYERFRVELADARIVYRTERELEPSPTA